MNYRQVHLDFHTSKKIRGIGKDFNKEQFQAMLIKGHVNSITVFSKCHHGWSYHPTKVNEMHPHLEFDLLKAQIEAAHEIGVKTPVYISAGFDEKDAVAHPEWLVRYSPDGEPDFSQPGYHRICLGSPYLDKLLSEIKEVCERYDADGIFLDIVSVEKCYCEHCKGKNPEEVYANYTRRVRETIDSVKPGLPVFHNGGHIRTGRRDLAMMNTHLELESLPTGGWGYDHFPMSAAYARTLGLEYLGMTGKFHTSWGEFGGYKHPNALRYEVALSAANGAKCSIGDQLHPSGMMDNATYTLIGEAYKVLEKAEQWLDGMANVADVAFLSNEAIFNYFGEGSFDISLDEMKKSDVGCSRILLESHMLFDMIDTAADFSKYKLIILPDNIKTDKALADKINGYVTNGGKVLATYKSGMGDKGFDIDIGCKYISEGEYKPSYIRPRFEIKSLANGAYIIYADNVKVENIDAEVLADTEKPYFNRTAEHFCSHKHAPSSGEVYGDGIVRKWNVAYATHKLFYEYGITGNIYTKEMVSKVIDDLLGDEVSIKTDLPAQGVVTLTEGGDRRILHALYATPVKRGEGIEIIEDIIPVYNTSVSVRTDKTPAKVMLVPEGTEIPFEYENGRVKFTIPKIDCWQMVEIV